MSVTMESANMMEENASTENGVKNFDSGHSNTCSNSQSHTRLVYIFLLKIILISHVYGCMIIVASVRT